MTPSLHIFVLLAVLVLGGCGSPEAPAASPTAADTAGAPHLAAATFAGGCFWCMEEPFDVLDGVASTTSGFTGGHVPDPTYQQVVAGRTGHAEVVRVVFDSTRISYAELLEVYWRNTDPLDGGGQFCDRGSTYRPAIFVHDDAQRRLAEASKRALEERFDQPIATEIVPATAFYEAEVYHQSYYRTNPDDYRAYRQACGRDLRLAELWGNEG